MTARVVRHPPGRAGRLWLQRRVTTARRGARLLDQKLRILRREQERFAALAERTGAVWEAHCAEAELWLLRAVAVGGQDCVRTQGTRERASVEVDWASVMGVRYPSEAMCRLPAEAAAQVSATAAAPLAVEAYRQALRAAVAHAAAQAAARVVAAEVQSTRSRLRAIEERWVPALEAALHEVEGTLDELERAEAVRLRWAAGRQGRL